MNVERTPAGGYRIVLSLVEGHALLRFLQDTDQLQYPWEPSDVSVLGCYPDVDTLRDELHRA